jgi:hypothetical protein
LVLQDTADGSDPKTFYESSEEDGGEFGAKKPNFSGHRKPTIMDADHRLLLRNARPLLNSRNAAVSYVTLYLLFLSS